MNRTYDRNLIPISHTTVPMKAVQTQGHKHNFSNPDKNVS